jgi:hypothetical protein
MIDERQASDPVEVSRIPRKATTPRTCINFPDTVKVP